MISVLRHQHAPMFSERWANRAIEVIFGFQTGITSHA
jgi:hypothetical protein